MVKRDLMGRNAWEAENATWIALSLPSSDTQGDCSRITGKFNCCYLTCQLFGCSYPLLWREFFHIRSTTNRPMNYTFVLMCVCKLNDHNQLGLPSRPIPRLLHYCFSCSPFLFFLPLFFFQLVCKLLNVSWNAPFPRSVSVDFIATKLTVEFYVAFRWLVTWPSWQQLQRGAKTVNFF